MFSCVLLTGPCWISCYVISRFLVVRAISAMLCDASLTIDYTVISFSWFPALFWSWLVYTLTAADYAIRYVFLCVCTMCMENSHMLNVCMPSYSIPSFVYDIAFWCLWFKRSYIEISKFVWKTLPLFVLRIKGYC